MADIGAQSPDKQEVSPSSQKGLFEFDPEPSLQSFHIPRSKARWNLAASLSDSTNSSVSLNNNFAPILQNAPLIGVTYDASAPKQLGGVDKLTSYQSQAPVFDSIPSEGSKQDDAESAGLTDDIEILTELTQFKLSFT